MRLLKWILIALGCAAIWIGWQGFDLARYAYQPRVLTAEAGGFGNSSGQILTVPRGARPQEIALQLETLGVVSNASKFVLLGRVTRVWGRLKAGEYMVSPTQTPMEILNTLSAGISVNYVVTIPEGENMYEVAAILEKAGFGQKDANLALMQDPAFIAELGLKDPAPKSLEGYLFPDTYQFPRNTSTREILKHLYKRFVSAWETEVAALAKARGMSRHQVVTLASIIEKETGAPEERPMISSVFHNRLSKRMRLQSDPTTIYGIWTRYTGNITRADLLTPTEYNTYTIPALPIGPIANPGKDALLAAVRPAESQNLYFVSQNDGRHVFSKTYEEHNAAVRRFQLDPKARQGKSWRDLKNGS